MRYGLALIGILAVFGGVVVATSFAVVAPPFSRYLTGPGTRPETVLLSLLTLVWWMATAPLWTWATASRYRRRQLPRWPALIPGGVSLLAILICLTGGLALGTDGPRVQDAFASVEDVMQDVKRSWPSRYVLSQILAWSNWVLAGAALIAAVLSLFNVRSDPPPDYEAFE